MKRKLTAHFLFVLMLAGLSGTVFAGGQEAIPVRFRKAGGGQFIYCNNPEFIEPTMVSSIENPDATYMMKNEGLKPDNYSVFFCFYNWSDFDIEPDIEFKTSGDAVVRIDSVGYYTPQGTEYWDCIGAWSDLMDMNIRTLNRSEQYVPYRGEKKLPATINLSGNNDWISRYIYNYEPVTPRFTFNMLVIFTIVSGEVDVNFTALRHYDKTGDRTRHNPDAAPGHYVRDTSVKGIDTETLPMVEADFNIEIDANTKNGENLMMKIFNQYHPDGNEVPYWVTNINPSRDAYMFSKNTAAGSDMLSLAYKDDTKLDFYGENVPEAERDNIWHMDIYHYDTKNYNPGMPGKAEDHIPNAFTSETLDINNLPDLNWQFNLGNFGVTNRYHLNITNYDAVPRTLNYSIESARSSNIVIARDETGTMLNPYTLEPENAFALCKGINWDEKKEDCMFSAVIAPGETKRYILDVILPTNNYGGQVNILKVDDHKLIEELPGTPFPEYTQYNPFKQVFFNGEQYMKWSNGELFRYTDENVWEPVPLPEETRSLFEKDSYEIRMVKTGSGYAARYSAWDRFGAVTNRQAKNQVYFLDENLQYQYSREFPDYIYNLAYADHTLYVQSDINYQSTGETSFEPMPSGQAFPVTNGKYTLLKKEDGNVYVREPSGEDVKISFEGEVPYELMSTGGLFYYRKSWQAYYTSVGIDNILSVSRDGLNWTDVVLPNSFTELLMVNYLNGTIYANSKYGADTVSMPLSGQVRVKLNGEYLSFLTPSKIVADRTMVPLRFFFEKLGAQVDWNPDTQEITVEKDGKTILMQIDRSSAAIDGREIALDTAPYLENGKTMIPLRFLSESLGYSVGWDAESGTATISASY